MDGLKMRTAAIVSLLAFQGCVLQQGTPKILDEAYMSKIERGKSTKADVENILGKPPETDTSDSGIERWHYNYNLRWGRHYGMAQRPRAYLLMIRFQGDVVEDLVREDVEFDWNSPPPTRMNKVD